MAELVFGIAHEVLEKLASIAYKEVFLRKSLETDVKKLEQTLSIIKAVLQDAKDKQPLDQALYIWLTQLEDVFNDAEDLVAEFESQVLRRLVEKKHVKIGTKVCRFFSCSNPLVLRLSFGHKIKEIRERLDDVAADRAKFQLTEKLGRSDCMMHGIRRQMTHSFVHAPEVVGRERGEEKLVNILMESNAKSNLSVLGCLQNWCIIMKM